MHGSLLPHVLPPPGLSSRPASRRARLCAVPVLALLLFISPKIPSVSYPLIYIGLQNAKRPPFSSRQAGPLVRVNGQRH